MSHEHLLFFMGWLAGIFTALVVGFGTTLVLHG